MPTLVLVRHTQAAYSYPDHTQPLTRVGVDQAVRLDGILSREIDAFDVVVCSDATHVQQTFTQVSQRMSIHDSWFDRGVYSADEEDTLTLARTFEDSNALIVGYEPAISDAGYVLACEDDRSEIARGASTAVALIFTFDGIWGSLTPSSCTPCVMPTPLTR